MTREETIKILSVLKAAYPNFYKTMTKEEAESTINLWGTMFVEEDYKLVGEAVKAHIATDEKGFPPVIGQIKSKIRQITQPAGMTEIEAWNLVLKACSNAGYNANEEFNKLPSNIQDLVGSARTLREWAVMDTSQLNTVVQSNFMRSYKARTENDRQYQALPPSVKELTKQIAQGCSMNRLLEGTIKQ